MKIRAFIDTNVFIFEFPASNSKAIVDLLNEDKIEVVISEIVIKEVIDILENFTQRDLQMNLEGTYLKLA